MLKIKYIINMKIIKKKVSIIVNCHNGQKYLAKCIQSIFLQKYTNWEIIFYDNCSDDESLNIVKSFKSKKIRIFKSKKKIKLYSARNAAISKATGEFIAFLDTDDYWMKNKILDQLKILNNRKVFISYTNFWIKNGKKFKIFKKDKLPSGKITRDILLDYPIYISTVVLKTEILFKNKIKFNPNYEILGDLDLFYRLSKKYNFVPVQHPSSVYRSHSHNTSKKRVDLKIFEMDDWLRKNKNAKNQYLFKNIEIENLYTKCNYFIANDKINLFLLNYNKIKNFKMKIKLFLKFIIYSIKKKL